MLNKIQLIGNVGKDPEVKDLQGGNKLCNITLATTEKWKDKSSGEMQSKTEWHNLVAFGNVVKVFENYVKKGSKIYVEGKLTTEQWDDKDGNKRYTTKIIVNQLILLDKKPTEQKSSENNPDNEVDDLPFG